MTPDDPPTHPTGRRPSAPYQEVPDQCSKVPALTVVDGHPLTDAGCGLFQKLPIRSIEEQNPVAVTQ